MMGLQSRLLPLVLALGLMLAPSAALANMANPVQPGAVTGEPGGTLKDVAIERETLTIDLRPLEEGQAATVQAIYQVRNNGPQRALELVFVTTGYSGGHAITLDGQPVEGTPVVGAPMPEAWSPPSTTPAIDGAGTLAYEAAKGFGVLFTVNLPPGQHEIVVSHNAKPTQYSGDSPTRYWQLGYVLAPARDWASFGGLDVTVHLPPGWDAASDPTLERVGDTLRGSFSSVPADALGITARASVPVVADPIPFVWLGGLILAAVAGWLAGRRLGWLGRSAWLVLPVGIVIGVVWFVVVLMTGFAAPPSVPPSQVAWTYGYGRGMLMLVASPLAVVGGVLVTQIAALIAHRSARTARARAVHRSRQAPAGQTW